MKFICKTHGVVKAEPDVNLDVICPECVAENIPFKLKPEHWTRAMQGMLESHPYYGSDKQEALQRAEKKVVEHLDEVEGMLEHQVINWLAENAPVTVLAEIVNHYYYTGMLEQRLKESREG